MTNIENQTAFQLTASAKQSVINAAENCGVENVVAEYAYSNDDDPILDLKDEDGNYLFSIDTSNNQIFEK